jgi:hypothetical protein
MKKPPLGITPKHIWEAIRFEELQMAINRYLLAQLPIPTEWIEEYNDFTKKLVK